MSKLPLILLFMAGCSSKGFDCHLVPRDGRPIFVVDKFHFYDPEELQRGADLWKIVGVNFIMTDREEGATLSIEELSADLKDKYWGFTGGNVIGLSDEIDGPYVYRVVAHELGHTLGLMHVDTDKWGGCHLMNSSICTPEDSDITLVDMVMYAETVECLPGHAHWDSKGLSP